MLAFLSQADCDDILARMTFRKFTPQTITTKKAFPAELAKVQSQG